MQVFKNDPHYSCEVLYLNPLMSYCSKYRRFICWDIVFFNHLTRSQNSFSRLSPRSCSSQRPSGRRNTHHLSFSVGWIIAIGFSFTARYPTIHIVSFSLSAYPASMIASMSFGVPIQGTLHMFLHLSHVQGCSHLL